MARMKKGLHGHYLSGKIGKTVHSTWRGIEYIKSAPGENKSSTSPQVEQRMRFALVTSALSPMKELFKTGYRQGADRKTEFNMAIAHCMKNAVWGIAPDLYIDFSRVQVCAGELPNVTASASAEKGSILFNWTNNAGLGKAKARDTAILIAYCEAPHSCFYTLEGPSRSAETAILQVPFYSDRTVQTWISFISADGKDIAPSVFTGQLLVK